MFDIVLLALAVILLLVSFVYRFVRQRYELQRQRDESTEEQLIWRIYRQISEQRVQGIRNWQQTSVQLQQSELDGFQDRIRATKNALVVMEVIADNSDNCGTAEQILLGNPTQGSPKQNSDDLEWVSDCQEESGCVICLRPFRVGDLVALSRRSNTCIHIENIIETENNCRHVFHRDCIEAWLINAGRDECPSCRTQLLRWEPLSSGDIELGLQKTDGWSMRFVIRNGLVSRLQATDASTKDEETNEIGCPLKDKSNNRLQRPNHTISSSILRGMSQLRLCDDNADNQGPAVRIGSGQLLLADRCSDAWQPPSLVRLTSSKAPFDCFRSLSAIEESHPQRRECQQRSKSELPWTMHCERDSSLQPRHPLVSGKSSSFRDHEFVSP